MTLWFVLLILGAYLLGSVPASYLVAKLSRGIDLRQYGTGQAGAGNLWRMTSWKLGLPVGLFDVSTGLVMVWIAEVAGLGIAQQLIVGSAAIAGHNWPIFLRFHGGRGIGTTIGVLLILPFLNDMSPWASAAFVVILGIGALTLRSTPVPALLAVAALPVVSLVSREPIPVTLGFLVIFLIIAIKRLTAQSSVDMTSVSKGQLLINRFLFDRDIRDRNAWMYRKPAEASTPEQTLTQVDKEKA